MGTRSRLLIRRAKSTIHLWMRWDGYFSGQGDEICKQILKLLQKFSEEELEAKVESLEVEDGEQSFRADDLEDFIVGNKVFYNDKYDDIEYEYVLDFRKQVLRADSLDRGACMITFAMMRDGYMCSDFENCLDN